MKSIFACVLVFLLVAVGTSEEFKHRSTIRATTLTIRVNGGVGTGNVAKVDATGTTWIFTAAHVIEGSREVKVYLHESEDGNMISETYHHADVMAYTIDSDLALLRLRKKNFGKPAITFSTTKPKMDDDVAVCGTFRGEHEHVISTGKVQSFGMKGLHKDAIYDMALLPCYGGCSGGGIFNSEGKYIGMIVAIAGHNIGYYLPLHKIQAWAKKKKVDFIFDPKAKMPDWEPLTADPKLGWK